MTTIFRDRRGIEQARAGGSALALDHENEVSGTILEVQFDLFLRNHGRLDGEWVGICNSAEHCGHRKSGCTNELHCIEGLREHLNFLFV